MPTRRHYWSNSKLADLVRGQDKPTVATGDEWVAWKKEAQAAHPFRFWLAETGLRKLQNIANWPLDRYQDLRNYGHNRWINRSHALTAHPDHIRPGTWADLDRRILRSMFDSLVDFVEIDLATFRVTLNTEAARKHGRPQAWRNWGRARWRSREAGLEHLEWEIALVHDAATGIPPEDDLFGRETEQARDAREIREIYLWYTETRPSRPHPHDVSGWTAYCQGKRARGLTFLQTDPDADKQETSRMLEYLRAIEDSYRDEDTEMLIRLVRIRHALWT